MPSKTPRASRRLRVRDLCSALETLAPTRLAQSWDNVGLIAGDRDAAVRRVLLCIDLTPDVADEAVEKRVQFVVAYHPPIFQPIRRLVVPSDDTSKAVLRCLGSKIAIYSTHTALDAADGGTNDCLARLCGITNTEPLEGVGGIENAECKIVTFVPAQDLDAVAAAMFKAGAGHIGDYRQCSFRIPGTGTFFGSESTRPAVGEAGRTETVEEIRLEAVTPRDTLPAVVDALRKAHSYEEPAFDIYPLREVPQRGIGRAGDLPAPTTLAALARKLKRLTGAAETQIVGPADRKVSRAVICAGAAGSLPFKVGLCERDVIVTGEIRHHDALTIRRRGCTAVALGHWASEHPVLQPFSENLRKLLPKLDVCVSEADVDPFAPI